MRHRSFRRAPAILVIGFGILAISAAVSAERPCSGDPALTGRICDEATCLALEDAKDMACANSPGKCIPGEGCFNLQQKSAYWHECYVARIRINACFAMNFIPGAPPPPGSAGGGDWDHQWQAAEAIRLASECDQIIAQPAPIGCGPCVVQVP